MTDAGFKVAIASSGLGHVARGIEAWAADLGRALAGRGIAVSLFKGGGQAEVPFETVIPCWQREAPRTKRLKAWLPRRATWRLGLGSEYDIEQTSFALRLLGHLRRERIAILHVQDPQVALLVQRAWRSGWLAARPILAHGTEEPLAFLRRIQYVQHLAPWHLEEARAAGLCKPTWTAIPNFIDSQRFRPGSGPGLRSELGIPPHGLVVLTAAAIKRHHKRIDYLLEEFAQLLRADPALPAWLVVAGGWEKDTDGLVEQGRALLGDRVRFLIRFPRDRMPDLYRTADLFVLCSLKEMMPIALLEAIASGLCCVVNRHPVLEWMLGRGGLATALASPGALAEILGPLLHDRATRLRLGEQARQHCLVYFSPDRVVEQIVAYYRFVNSHPRRPAREPAGLHG